MDGILVFIFLAIGGYVAYKVVVVARNVTNKAISTGREINTRLSDAITCGNCATKLPTTTQLPCDGCGFTKTRNLASACPNCGRKAQFVNCPKCGDSITFA